MADDPTLPRLLYIGDVPVESSYHGSALLYRLLEDYPAGRLLILECDGNSSLPERRLPGTTYVHLPPGRLLSRLQNTRFHQWSASSRLLGASGGISRIERALGDFQPEAVLTVAQGYAWLAAARFARERGLPLHLVVHDDWPTLVPVIPQLRPQCHRVFRRVYQQAFSRLCVSPPMAEDYERRYGVSGHVLYPSRKAGGAAHTSPPDRTDAPARPFTVGYMGTLSAMGYVMVLRLVAAALGSMGGMLRVYGPVSPGEAPTLGLDLGNVMIRGLIPADAIVSTVREECDALVVPMSFAPEDAVALRLNFPSKLTDCSAAALPILIVSPPDLSAARWATDNHGVALLVTDLDTASIQQAIELLAADPQLRAALGSRAGTVGARQFSAQEARHEFHAHLSGNPAPITPSPPS